MHSLHDFFPSILTFADSFLIESIKKSIMIVFAYENANYYNPLILSIQRSYPSGAMQSALL